MVHLGIRLAVIDAIVVSDFTSRVYLARKKMTGDLYAIKVLRKMDVLRKNQARTVMIERDAMARVHHPFVVQLYFTFQSVPSDLTLRFVVDVVGALSVHGDGVSHRRRSLLTAGQSAFV